MLRGPFKTRGRSYSCYLGCHLSRGCSSFRNLSWHPCTSPLSIHHVGSTSKVSVLCLEGRDRAGLAPQA